MSRIPDNPQAFPEVTQDSDGDWRGPIQSYGGMSLMDYFAGQALSGLLAAERPGYEYDRKEDAVSAAYRVAIAMLEHREDRV